MEPFCKSTISRAEGFSLGRLENSNRDRFKQVGESKLRADRALKRQRILKRRKTCHVQGCVPVGADGQSPTPCAGTSKQTAYRHNDGIAPILAGERQDLPCMRPKNFERPIASVHKERRPLLAQGEQAARERKLD